MLNKHWLAKGVRGKGRGAFASVLILLGLGLQAQAADIKTGLKAYWNFDAKNVKDSVGAFNGTENGSAPLGYTGGKAGFGQALVLDGVDQFVEITGGEPDDLAFEGASMSIAGWFRVGTFDKSWQALVAKGEGSSWRVHRRGSESGFAHAGGTGEGPAGGAVDDGLWHHFVAISDAAGVNFGTALYVDGVQYTANASTPNLAANGKRMMIGENPDARGRTWNGELDDIAVWDRVLTEAEIAQLYNKGVGTPLSSLLGAGPADTDKDGMPDDWENQYGLNPNDPSDAAKDYNANGLSNLDEYKSGFDPRDTVKPTILSGATTAGFDTIVLNFSKPLDPATATNIANYVITPSLAVTAATLKSATVTLTTAKQTPGATAYTVAVSNVKSANSLTIAANSKVVVYSYLMSTAGVLKFSYWGGVSGSIDSLYSDPRYPATPDLVLGVYGFNSRYAFPDDSHENYGATIEGFVSPAETGSYRFFIYSDDASQLFLSTDDKEANLQQIAEETGCCNFFTEPDSPRTSEPIALTAGKKYFVRLVYKEGGGGDYGQVAWRKEGDKTPAGSLTPIPGKYLSSATALPYPADGLYATQSPAPNSKGVSPAAAVSVVHLDGQTPWTAANTTLSFDGKVIAPTPLVKDGAVATLAYKPSGLLGSKTRHTVSLVYKDAGGKSATNSWSFEVAAYSGTVKDVVKGYEGLVRGSAVQTADKGGSSAKAGDRAMDLTAKGGPVQVLDNNFLAAVNAATAADELSVSLNIKKYDIADSSAIWFSSPSQGRVFQAHTPWSNNNIYFDTAGCCDGGTQRINAGIDSVPALGYAGDNAWWQVWRSYVFTKKGAHKQIWVDGTLFLEGDNTGLLSTDINQFMIGSDNGGGGLMHALVDNVAVYSKALTPTDIAALKSGTAPTALASSAGLIADWDFNAPPPTLDALASGLVAAWSFDGNLNDSINGHNGTARGKNPINYVAGRDGFGQAIKLNGITGGVTNIDQYVEITGGNDAQLEFPKGSVSIAGWFKVGAFDHDWQALLSKGENNNYRIARRGGAADGNGIAYAGGAGEGPSDIAAVNDDQWHHFVAVSDASPTGPFGTALYIDGVLHSVQVTKPAITDSSKPLFIGENPEALGRQWNGLIDDIGIWNRVLSAAEVASLWNSGAGLPLSSLPKAATPPTATVTRSGSNITIQWTPAGGTLESSPTLGAGAVWTTVGTSNPTTVAVGAANLFYRVRQ